MHDFIHVYKTVYEELNQCINLLYLITLTNVLFYFFLTISEVSISIASSFELRSLLAVVDLDGGST